MAKIDDEIEAIKTVLTALEPLSPEVRSTVLDYVVKRLGVPQVSTGAAAVVDPVTLQDPLTASSNAQITHIKQLKEIKKPRSNNEMAAVVAFYLAHHAPQNERKTTINRQDIETYFRIGEYPLPEQPQFALANAKNAGYFEMVGGGEYKLNPVGDNLVAHSLPRGTGKKRKKKKSAKKKTKKKTKKKSTARKKRARKKSKTG